MSAEVELSSVEDAVNPETSEGIALSVRGVEVAYGRHDPVLVDVSIDVAAGSVVALLGANGAGKSTLLRAISGLLPVHHGQVVKGQVIIDGRDVTSLPAAARVRSGLAQVPEGRRVFAELSVDENLRAGAFLVRDRRQIADDLARIYDRFPAIAGRKTAQAGYLSGGEQQMVAFGRALMSRPKLLLLDEPSLGLAPQLVEAVSTLIAEINRQGTTILLVEQNVVAGLALADWAYVMETGRVVASDSAAALQDSARLKGAYLGGHAAGVNEDRPLDD